MTAVLVALGAGAGATARWWADREVQRRTRGSFPWGTFVINVTGSFVLGLLLAAAAGGSAGTAAVALLGTGFCGGLTTFSTFGFESVRLAEEGLTRTATAYVLGSVAAAVGAAAAGWAAGSALWP